MGELMKNVGPTMMGIGMLGSYNEVWESMKIYGIPEGPRRSKSSIKMKIPVKNKGKSPKKDGKKIGPSNVT